MVATSFMWLLNVSKIPKFLSFTSHISSGQYPHVASGYYSGQHSSRQLKQSQTELFPPPTVPISVLPTLNIVTMCLSQPILIKMVPKSHLIYPRNLLNLASLLDPYFHCSTGPFDFWFQLLQRASQFFTETFPTPNLLRYLYLFLKSKTNCSIPTFFKILVGALLFILITLAFSIILVHRYTASDE